MGSKKPDLQSEALAIFSMTIKHQIRIEPEWITRTLNQQANWLSRIVDYDDWAIHPDHFRMINEIWVQLPLLEPRNRGCRCLHMQLVK